MAFPMFSIIVVSLNAGDKLLETIESIREQSFTDYEVVIKDGGSKDGSVEFLKKQMLGFDTAMRNRIRLFEEKDSSIYDGMNQAVEKAEGKYLYFLNCGDYFYDERVLERVAEMAWMNHLLNAQVPPLPQHILNKHYTRNHGKNAYYGQK